MARPLMLSLVPVAVLAVAACGRSAKKSGSSADADLQRDLKLASTSTMNLATPRTNLANFSNLETAPRSAPDSSRHLVKGPGPQALPSKVPEVKAAPSLLVSATQTIPQVEAVNSAPAPGPTSVDPVATVPRAGPAPSIGGMGGTGVGDYGQGQGALPGTVIWGGAGDGDHCEPMGRHGGPVYYPMPFPVGGMGGGARLPPARPSVPRRP